MASSPDPATPETASDDVQLEFERVSGTAAFRVTLPDGKKLRIERRRDRVVPGVGGLGPLTGALYELAMAELGDAILAGTVADIGAGCGLGTRLVVARAKRVVAIEPSEEGAAFARAFAARATIVESTIEAATIDTPADGAIAVDVLGFVESPLSALRAARRILRKGGRLAVVEPLAYPAQSLVAPARRAMAPSQLGALLESAGFSLIRCGQDGGIAIAVAEAVEDPDVDALARGADFCMTGELDEALACFDRSAASPKRSVAVQSVLDAVDVLVAQGRADDACSRLLAILRRFPDEARPLAALSQFMVAAGEPAEARMLAEKAAKFAPLEPAVLAAHAIALQVSREGDAVVAWRRAYNLAPDALEIALPASACALESGHPLLAERILSRCMAYTGNPRAEGYLMRARARIALGRLEDAKLDAQLALRTSPESEEAAAMVESLERASAA